MRRAVYLLTFILIIATGAIMLWQWQVYSEALGQSEKEKTTAVEQLIHIEQTNKRLAVEQTISGLKAGTYTIGNPMEVAYTIEGEYEMAPAYVQVKEGQNEITFLYDIPFEWNDLSTLLTDWAVELKNTETVKAKVELIVTAADKRTGSWAAGAPLIGKVKKDTIDYYVFVNEGPVYPLYYQSGELSYAEIGENSAIFYEEGNQVSVEQLKDLLGEFSSVKNQISILTSKHDSLNRDDILILDNRLSIDQLRNELAFIEVNALFPFQNDEERWQQYIIHNLTEDTYLGGLKAKKMVEVLKSDLLEHEVDMFVQSVREINRPLSATILDEVLSSTLNKDTAFFSLNSKESEEIVPLYFYDEQNISVNGSSLEEPIVYLENRKLVPFLAIIAQVGFQYEIMDTGEILLTRADDMLRMYPGENVFILNRTDYSVKSIPIIFIHPPLLTSANFIYQMEDLSRNYQVITFDMRGHGRSSYSTRAITYELIVEDISLIHALDGFVQRRAEDLIDFFGGGVRG